MQRSTMKHHAKFRESSQREGGRMWLECKMKLKKKSINLKKEKKEKSQEMEANSYICLCILENFTCYVK